jgi:glucose/arabinose dehydrogenase
MFNPNLQPGDPDYGMMFFGIGDGGNFPTNPDPYNQAQNPGLAPGKIFCIDPLQQSDRPYGIPADNPFVGRAGYLPEIWALGFRHPQNLCFDTGGDRVFLIADIGQANIEEINIGVKGGNYGWSLREGTFVTDLNGARNLYALPPDDANRGFIYPVAQYDHSEGVAVTGGFVYRGTAVPALVGHYLFGDIRNGRIFHIPVSDLVLGQQAPVRELTLTRGGTEVTLLALANSANGRVDLRFGQDHAGEMYIMSKQDGWIRRMQGG